MDAAEPRQQFKPHGTISFELGEFARIDLVTQVACNHAVILHPKIERVPHNIWNGRFAPF
jgi:hypothetical protein